MSRRRSPRLGERGLRARRRAPEGGARRQGRRHRTSSAGRRSARRHSSRDFGRTSAHVKARRPCRALRQLDCRSCPFPPRSRGADCAARPPHDRPVAEPLSPRVRLYPHPLPCTYTDPCPCPQARSPRSPAPEARRHGRSRRTPASPCPRGGQLPFASAGTPSTRPASSAQKAAGRWPPRSSASAGVRRSLQVSGTAR